MKNNTTKKNLIFLTSAMFIIATLMSCNSDNCSCPDADYRDTLPSVIPVILVSLNANLDTLAIGQTLLLEPTFQPADATNQNVGWSSSDNTVATVANGAVTALSFGSTLITVTTQDAHRTDTCRIVVSNARNLFCNMLTPGWGETFGAVSFHNQGHNVVVSGNGITQTWSGAVTATNCQKNIFSGGTVANFNADCRSNPNFPGDFFSWCAIIRFADVLCPYPWRVPTTQDFINLHMAMGSSYDVQENYIERWGGTFGGFVDSDGTLLQSEWGHYWSQTQSSATGANNLSFCTHGNVLPSGYGAGFKGHGLPLRCVR